MKYEPPYGSPGSNDPYINGNPSTGTMGSIPPAASIENPQREIVNYINDSGLTASDADLHQLSKSVQSGKVNYAIDAGAANFIAITPTPAVVTYALGQRFNIKVLNSNTGPTQLNVSNVGWTPIVHSDLTALGGGEILAGQMIDVAWDGSHWQLLTGGRGGLIFLTAPRTLYVDAALGSDTLYDGTQATVDAANGHGPFQTLPKALSVMTTYNLSGFLFTIQMAGGVYNHPSVITLPLPNGSGTVIIRGNPANPAAVQIINNGTGTTLVCNAGSYYLDGVILAATAATGPGDAGNCLWLTGPATIWLAAVSFGPCPGSHMLAAPGGWFSIAGPITITGGANAHITASANGSVQCYPNPFPNLTFSAAVTFAQFALATTGSQLGLAYTTINNAGSCSGQKYVATGNGVINTQGRGASYLPGTVAGATASGGQYL